MPMPKLQVGDKKKLIFMKNYLFFRVSVMFIFCAMFSVAVNAQNTFNKGDKIVNLGIGLGGTFSGYTSAIPISGSFELGIKDNLFDDKSSIGVGAYVGFATTNHVTFLYPGVRGALHYQFVDKLDTYAGLMLAMRIWSYEGYSYNDFILPFYIGGRYYFTDNIGAFAELGYGIAYLQLGVSFKF